MITTLLIIILVLAGIGALTSHFLFYRYQPHPLTDLQRNGLDIRPHTGKPGGRLRPQATIVSLLSCIKLPGTNISLLRRKRYDLTAPPARLILGPTAPIAAITERYIPGAESQIPIRVYTPYGKGPFPGLIYFHGGGFSGCSIDSHENITSHIAHAAGAVVVSVGYRLAPEHPFPAGLNDAYRATTWVTEHASEMDIDPGWIAIGGDSAGANLATVVAMQARDRNGPRLDYQILLYPVTNLPLDTPSVEEYPQWIFLSQNDMIGIRQSYAPDPETWRDPHASPLLADDLRGLPPAMLITAEFDPLRDEGERYGKRLHEANIAVHVTRYVGLPHAFYSMRTAFPRAFRQATQEIAATIRTAYHVEQNGRGVR